MGVTLAPQKSEQNKRAAGLRYFMPMGDVGGKVAVAFGVLFVLLVVGVALKEVMD